MNRHRLHMLLGALLWAVFGYYWFTVVQRPITDYTKIALSAVGSIVVIVTLVMFAWAFHNVRLASRNRRVNRHEAPAGPSSDFLGRTFASPDDERLHTAQYIEVHIIDSPRTDGIGHKVFRATETIPEP